jgi:rhodanese-related sulfurtransferase
MIKRVIFEVVVIALFSICLSVGVNSFRSDGLPLFSDSSRQSPATAANDNVRPISIEQAILRYREGKALFADARSSEDYAAGHIRGAVNLPEQQMDQWLNDILMKEEPSRLIITYCDGQHCPLALRLAQELHRAGFENVYYLPDGWKKWQDYNMPTEKSE